MGIQEPEENVVASRENEPMVLSRYIEQRDEILSSMERLSVYRATQNPFTVEYSSIWSMYNRRLRLDLESFRRHIASVKAWALIIPELINDGKADTSSVDILIRDYALPQIYYLIDAPQAINNQINQGVLRLNILWEDPSSRWEEMQEKVAGLKNGVYTKAKDTAFACSEWDELSSALNALHENESAKHLQSLHGDKYHDIASPPFVAFSVPWQEGLASGVKAFGFREDTLDVDMLLDCATTQLRNAHNAYERFNAYANRLYAECIKRMGGEYTDD